MANSTARMTATGPTDTTIRDIPRGVWRRHASRAPRNVFATLLACMAASALALSGCGGSTTKTVSVSSAPAPQTTTQRTTTASTTPSPTTTTQTTTSTTTTAPPAAETTRTTAAPAFTKQPTTTEGLSAALAIVKEHGYAVADTSDYHPQQTLRVLVGTREGAPEGHAQQAFFFVDGRYLGTDTKQPSATVDVVDQSDTEVTLAYPLYRPHDSLCCPGGGQATVHFQLNNGQLVALNPIPPASSTTGLSRQ